MTVAASPALIRRIVAEDHRLEASAASATRELMYHRWHWTLDKEGNPEHLTLNAYATKAGRSYAQIAKYARGYELLMENERARAQGYSVHTITPTDAYELAGASEARRAATEAVQQAHKKADGTPISAVNARQHYGDEVRAIRDRARDRAEKKGTSELEEIPAAAKEFYESMAAAVAAVAQYHGISTVNARQHHQDAWSAIRNRARDRAEDNQTSELEEIPAAAEEFYRQPQAAKVNERQRLEEEQRRLREEHQRQETERQRLEAERAQLEAERAAERERRRATEEIERQRLEIEQRHQEAERRYQEAAKQRHSERFFEVTGLLQRLRELGRKALEAVEGVAFDDEERDILAGEINDARRLIDTLDQAVVGRQSPRWKDEMAVLQGGRDGR